MSNLLTFKPEQGSDTQIYLDETNRSVYVDGKRYPLTEQEYCLLSELAQHPGEPVSRDELLRTAWGYITPGETRTVDVHVQRLRKKLGSETIATVYRFGYKLQATPA
jgi:two-component system alkaline phosphatase synthesis response regulator PhoP